MKMIDAGKTERTMLLILPRRCAAESAADIVTGRLPSRVIFDAQGKLGLTQLWSPF
jgi:hypothetical protein